ncbi:MAG: putative transposase [Crocinitomicaceae bacterium]|jgi:putative transposase
MTITDFVKQLKRASTHWIQNEMNAPHFKWQEGYGAFSVSTSHLD